MATPHAVIGRAAPSLHIRDSRGRVVTLGDLDGEPVVLALCASWSASDVGDATIAALRAELRGLGAALVIVSAEGVWRFRADDDWALGAAATVGEGELVALRERFGVDGLGLSLFVIDGEKTLRFARSIACTPLESTAALLDALSIAGRATVATVATHRPSMIAVSRRELVVTSLLSAFALVLAEACRTKEAPTAAPTVDASITPPDVPEEIDVTLDVNGAARTIRIDARVSLLDALRERMGLPGTKKGCDHGQCGACTVLVDGRRVNACLTLAVMAQGTKITTIEGLAQGDALHPMQTAFVTEDGFQCGYCTPGQIMSAIGLVREGHAQTDDEVREEMSGNICRCGAYSNIVTAVQLGRKGARA